MVFPQTDSLAEPIPKYHFVFQIHGLAFKRWIHVILESSQINSFSLLEAKEGKKGYLWGSGSYIIVLKHKLSPSDGDP